ncbi:hypothetical protein AAER08_24745 [Pseudomonas aeruginosa]|nr:MULTISPECIES: hypothetical protein [Pseudomonas]ERY37799.1 hypothetical protein Q067_00617 [Pseudomonas aeruginosa BL13]KSI66928.1 hypothetical protein AO992_29645 [Pseudomonas aeruginosa]KSR94274.1 hypothetical protein APB61_24870 [Pseudomonas aeruginosa]MBG6489947.1 hypothetical protein [Pseudomonas aeruginosa]MBG6606874.1 hypothetical protein [Pseudomonas aeruginosa]
MTKLLRDDLARTSIIHACWISSLWKVRYRAYDLAEPAVFTADKMGLSGLSSLDSWTLLPCQMEV